MTDSVKGLRKINAQETYIIVSFKKMRNMIHKINNGTCSTVSRLKGKLNINGLGITVWLLLYNAFFGYSQ